MMLIYSFFEFLSASGNEKLRSYLEKIVSFGQLPIAFHDNLIKLLKYYYFIGGMPEVVSEYIQHKKLGIVREVQLEILDAYEKDFAKHAPKNQIMKITAIWKQISSELAKENKKFVFANIKKSARSKDYEEAIQWLTDAGLIYKSFLVKTPRLPLSSNAIGNIFKLFFIDVGLLGAQSNLSAKTLIDRNELFVEFKGALTENYVAQEFDSIKS